MDLDHFSASLNIAMIQYTLTHQMAPPRFSAALQLPWWRSVLSEYIWLAIFGDLHCAGCCFQVIFCTVLSQS